MERKTEPSAPFLGVVISGSGEHSATCTWHLATCSGTAPAACSASGQPSWWLNTRTAFIPPKPNDSDNAVFTGASRLTFGT